MRMCYSLRAKSEQWFMPMSCSSNFSPQRRRGRQPASAARNRYGACYAICDNRVNAETIHTDGLGTGQVAVLLSNDSVLTDAEFERLLAMLLEVGLDEVKVVGRRTDKPVVKVWRQQ